MGTEASLHLPAMSITNTDIEVLKSCCGVTRETMVTAQLGFGGFCGRVGNASAGSTTKGESKSGEGPSTAPQPTHDTKQ